MKFDFKAFNPFKKKENTSLDDSGAKTIKNEDVKADDGTQAKLSSRQEKYLKKHVHEKLNPEIGLAQAAAAAEASRKKKNEIEPPKKMFAHGGLGIKFLKLKELKKKETIKRKRKLSFKGFARSIDLQEYLEKAGLERTDARTEAKKIFKFNIFLGMVISAAIIILCIIFKFGIASVLVLLLSYWLTAFFFILAVSWAIYLFYLDMKIFNRTKAVEDVFPDFLQLTSANISAGMPIDRALWYAVRPGFGVLAKEIEQVAKNTMAGEDLGVALTNFANKYNSKTIRSSISLLLEGMSAGGEMADLLNKISLNIEETKILKKEMAANVTTYVIFITFATIVAAPVLFGLATQLLIIIKEITSKLGSTMSTSSSFFSISFSADSIKTIDFRIFSYLMLIISSISSACIVSVIKKGRIKEGLSSIPVYVIVSIAIYTLAAWIIGSMFKGFI